MIKTLRPEGAVRRPKGLPITFGRLVHGGDGPVVEVACPLGCRGEDGDQAIHRHGILDRPFRLPLHKVGPCPGRGGAACYLIAWSDADAETLEAA
jgi:hypothetical protein